MGYVIKSVQISTAMNKQLTEIAKKFHKSDSELIREALLVLIGNYINASQTERK